MTDERDKDHVTGMYYREAHWQAPIKLRLLMSTQVHSVAQFQEAEKLLHTPCIHEDSDISPVQPLTFDRVSGSPYISSSFPWFRLPIELIAHVVKYLDTEELAALALVDRDCLQLARSVQFATIRFSFSENSVRLIMHLCKEVISRLESKEDGNTGHRFIGPCVRRLIVACDRRRVEQTTNLSYGSVNKASSLAKAWELYQTCLSSIEQCITSAFPNLELFRYVDLIPLRWSLLSALSQARIKHLLLDHFAIERGDKGNDFPDASLGALDWASVQTLRINLVGENQNMADTLSIVRHLFKSIASSCSTLIVEGLQLNSIEAEFLSGIFWPQLRRLGIKHNNSLRNLSVRSFFAAGVSSMPSLQTLWVDCIDSPTLLKLGRISSLNKLIIEDISMISRDVQLDFLSSNSQLKFLSFTFPIKQSTILDKLLPTLVVSKFTSLTVLRLTSASTRFSRRALTAIGLLNSLEKLWLSAGSQTGWRYDWFIDHDTIQNALRHLKNLSDLAFTRESYHCEEYRNHADEQVSKAYYSTPILPPGVSENSVLSKKDAYILSNLVMYSFMKRSSYIWEKWHRTQMLRLAAKYVAMFPKLNFLYLGEYPMSVINEWQGAVSTRRAVNMTEERDLCLELLDEKWGRL